MSETDQLTFDDQDEVKRSGSSDGNFPQTNLDDQNEFQEFDLSHIVNFPDTDMRIQREFEAYGLGDADDSPATDLSAAFSEGEHAAEGPMHDEHEPLPVTTGSTIKRALLVVLLLLVVVGAAGAYYFLNQGSPAPAVPGNARTSTTPAAFPPVPVAEPAVQNASDNQVVGAENPSTVAVAQPVEDVTADTPKEQVVNQPAGQAAGVVSEPQGKATKPTPEAAPTQQKAADAVLPVATPVKPAGAAEPPIQHVSGGIFTLDAGSYLMESNRDSLVTKIQMLGYQPLVTPIKATLEMTRLRLGTYSKEEVQEALGFARSIEPGSYSAPDGDRYVIYAGTFLKSSNVEKLSQRFLGEGVTVDAEPVKVTRTLSRIRFGRFATEGAAATAAQKAEEIGLKAAIVTYK